MFESRQWVRITFNQLLYQKGRGFRCNRPLSCCVHCRAHLARHQDLISKSFQGSQGRAYLFDTVVNVSCGKPEERLLLTGIELRSQ
ncbi:unnamed protein product [Schistosoma rodhaini]|uniref:Yippee domain-containing protein n=1 Tax=Schistosoma rodhaini TaxID=6188 RepID=A0AA85EXT3_9TREM|nr:unnamed protein product [Schistosoma rodhaini]